MEAHRTPLTRAELLAHLEAGWGRFLAALGRLSPADQAEWARAQGYPRVEDLLAHVCAWHEEGLHRVPALLVGEADPDYDIAAFNAQAVAQYRGRSRAALETEFTRLNAELAAQIATLPDSALANRDVYSWLYINAVEHYEEHRPPAGGEAAG